MTTYDIVIIIVIGGLTLWGVLKGFLRALADVIGLVAGVFLISKFASPLAMALPPASWSLIIKTFILGIIIMIATIIMVRIIAGVLRRIIIHGPLKTADRLIGGIVGATKAVILILVVLILLTISPYGSRLVEISEHSPVLGRFMSITTPLVNKYQETFINTISIRIVDLLPTSPDTPTAQIKQEIALFIKKIGSTTDLQERKKSINNLTSESRKYMKQLCDDLSEKSQKKDPTRKIPPDLKWLAKQINISQLTQDLNR